MSSGTHIHHPPMAIMLSSGSDPSTLDDLNNFHKDPMYELITGAKDAFYIQKLANKLGVKITRSEDIKNISSLVSNASSELERNWRMAACIANAPVSTGYPYLPTMPSSSAASSGTSDGASASAPTAGQGAGDVTKASLPLGTVLMALRPCTSSNKISQLRDFI